jgi:hypothetical protein
VVCLVNQNAEICEREEEVKRSSDPKCENGGVVEAPMEFFFLQARNRRATVCPGSRAVQSPGSS